MPAQLGRALGVNGVWGNMGTALASGISAALAGAFGWRAAFYVPGVVLIASGVAFVLLVKEGEPPRARQTATHKFQAGRRRVAALLAVFLIALLAGGLTFNIVSIALPKIVDERLGLALPLTTTGWITTVIFVCGAHHANRNRAPYRPLRLDRPVRLACGAAAGWPAACGNR